LKRGEMAGCNRLSRRHSNERTQLRISMFAQ
jgi:hypothetical protein